MQNAEKRRLNRMGQYAASMPPRRRGEERSKATVPFDFAQGRESFDFAQDREPVERPVERQMMPCWWIRWVTLSLVQVK